MFFVISYAQYILNCQQVKSKAFKITFFLILIVLAAFFFHAGLLKLHILYSSRCSGNKYSYQVYVTCISTPYRLFQKSLQTPFSDFKMYPEYLNCIYTSNKHMHKDIQSFSQPLPCRSPTGKYNMMCSGGIPVCNAFECVVMMCQNWLFQDVIYYKCQFFLDALLCPIRTNVYVFFLLSVKFMPLLGACTFKSKLMTTCHSCDVSI